MSSIAIIDIGSNSVRIRISSGGKVFFRETITTQLAKDMSDNMLSDRSIIRTFDGLDKLIFSAKEHNAKIYAFATAAVRNSKNGNVFTEEFYKRYSFNIDVISGELESKIGINGAIGGADNGTVIDVGGASSEIAVKQNGKIVYAHSVPIGAVLLTDLCGNDKEKAKNLLGEYINEYKKVPFSGNLYAIGGTATSLSTMIYGDNKYDREVNNGRKVLMDKLAEFADYLYTASVEELTNNFAIGEKRALVIHSGAMIILSVMQYLNADCYIVSENDNLEGYYDYIMNGAKDE